MSGTAPAFLLIAGDNAPEREAVLDTALSKALAGQDDPLARSIFQGSETDGGQLSIALTPSLFSSSGAVIVQGIEECSAAICEVLLQGIPGALESGISVFLVGEKGPNQSSKAGKALSKLVKEKGKDIACPAPKLHELPRWVEARCASRYQRKMDRDAASLLVERAGTTDWQKVGDVLPDLDRELEKLAGRTEPKLSISVALVDELVGDRRPASLQDFLDALSHRKPGETIKALGRLREEGLPGFLLAQRAWTEFAQLFRLRKAIDAGVRPSDAAAKLSINRFVFEKRGWESAARSRSAKRWQQDLLTLCNIEAGDKRGRFQQDWLLDLEFYQISR